MYLASIDCGTTNSRVYIIDTKGNIVGKGSRRVGVRDTSMTGSKDTLKQGLAEALQEALDAAGLTLQDIAFAISAGMITSEIGLLEIPHLQTPCGMKELAGNLKYCRDDSVFPVDLPIHFIPGIRNRFDPASTGSQQVGTLDFMRGEEVQVMGYLDRFGKSKPVVIVILSSHTKFIQVSKEGKVLKSLTSLSGQVYEAIRKETFIGKSVQEQEGVVQPENYLDPDVVENAYHWQRTSGFVRSLLMIRFLDVLLHTSWYERRLFFESLIAAEDIHAFGQFEPEGQEKPHMVFIGPKGRCDVYAHLFEHKLGWPVTSIESISDTQVIDMLNIQGSLAIARAAGLLHEE
ncbi:MAG: 2-dehydro-3-deoxygalactonokinase [Sphaerochaetaceae bacterium]